MTQTDIAYDTTLYDQVSGTAAELNDPFETLIWAQNTEHNADLIKSFANRLFNEYLMIVYEEGYTSAKYQILFPSESVYSVDCQELIARHPRIYEDLVFISANDAVKILGKKRLYAQCISIDPARTNEFSRVNLTDLRKALRPEEVSFCIKSYEKPLKPVVTLMENPV